MTTIAAAPPTAPAAVAADQPIPVTRRRIDMLLVAVGAAAAVVLFVAGGLLLWGATFASDYVHDELQAQNISFPPASALEEEGRDDLVQYADQQVDTGAEAEAYAGFIAGHVEGIADGATYSELGDEERAAEAAATDAITSGAPAAEVAALEEEAAEITGQRDSIFRGEMLRGTLLNTYAWDTIGRIAGIAAWVAFGAAAVMTGLVVAGGVHLRRLHRDA
jgi:hypothetical protein